MVSGNNNIHHRAGCLLTVKLMSYDTCLHLCLIVCIDMECVACIAIGFTLRGLGLGLETRTFSTISFQCIASAFSPKITNRDVKSLHSSAVRSLNRDLLNQPTRRVSILQEHAYPITLFVPFRKWTSLATPADQPILAETPHIHHPSLTTLSNPTTLFFRSPCLRCLLHTPRNPPSLILLPISRVTDISRHQHANNDDVAYESPVSISRTLHPHPSRDTRAHPLPEQKKFNSPSTNPTIPLMRSKMLEIRSCARPKTDWMAETKLLRMPERISKTEETRFCRPEMREDMVAVVVGAWRNTRCVDGRVS